MSTARQEYDPTPLINELRRHVDRWRGLTDPGTWGVTPGTARLLQHWRGHPFASVRPFFCQVEGAAITRAADGTGARTVVLDAYTPEGSTAQVRFSTSRPRWATDARRCHVNWIVLDSDWEAEFCRVAESHPRVRAYIKNHGLGFEVPYRFGSEERMYRRDFIGRVDDGHVPGAGGQPPRRVRAVGVR